MRINGHEGAARTTDPRVGRRRRAPPDARAAPRRATPEDGRASPTAYHSGGSGSLGQHSSRGMALWVLSQQNESEVV